MVNVQHIDHVALATWSIADAYRLFADTLGGEFVNGGDDEKLGIRTLQLRLGTGMKIELLQPLDEESYLYRFLEKHGQGFHHMTLFLDDVSAAADELAAQGYELVDPDYSDPTWREIYLRPRSGFGTVLQLADTTIRWDVPVPGITAQDVLDGTVLWHGTTPTLRE